MRFIIFIVLATCVLLLPIGFWEDQKLGVSHQIKDTTTEFEELEAISESANAGGAKVVSDQADKVVASKSAGNVVKTPAPAPVLAPAPAPAEPGEQVSLNDVLPQGEAYTRSQLDSTQYPYTQPVSVISTGNDRAVRKEVRRFNREALMRLQNVRDILDQ